MKWAADHWIAISPAGLFMAGSVLVGLLIRDALVQLSGDQANIEALAAVIALIGVLITAAVTLVGQFLRQAIDLRTTKLAEDAATRAKFDAQRLQMQAALETVRTLATADGEPAPRTQSSAALIVLARLGEVDLALSLAGEMWPATS